MQGKGSDPFSWIPFLVNGFFSLRLFELDVILREISLSEYPQYNCQEEPELEENIKVIVNGQSLSVNEFYRQKQYLQATYNQRQMTIEQEELEKLAFEQLIGQTLLMQEAEKEGIKPSAEQIEENVVKIKSQFPDEQEFTKALESQNMTVEQLEADIFKELSISGYLENAIASKETVVTDEEISSLYEQYKVSAGDQAQSLELVKPQIEQMVKQQKVGEAISDVVEGLKAQSKIEII